MTAHELTRRYRDWQSAISRLEAEVAIRAADLLAQYGAQVGRVLAAGTHPTGLAVRDRAEAEKMLREIDDQLEAMLGAQKQLFGQGFRKSVVITNERMAAMYRGLGVSPSRFRAASEALDDYARVFADASASRWVTEFRGAAGATLRQAIEGALVDAHAFRWDSRDLARALVQIPEFQFENLPPVGERGMRIFTLSGSLGESDALTRRAHMIARTELNTVANRDHLLWTQEVFGEGVKYVNVNSDPVAVECKEANEQPPMTLPEWDAWRASNGRGGRPSRHPHCDSGLMAISAELAADLERERPQPQPA